MSGVVGNRVADAVSSTVEPGPDGSVLVGEYVDQAYLTGVINRLHDLRIQILRIEIVEEAT
ncbi:MAG: hypothetical protein QNJ12_15015 [Ilumatobacter sp.]|uniref:hypothetical protein n=1 Tax=Ilumatobacter sp. TaxID=1967498 RepID=UPI00261631EA|nr:hypothetical protein [Ilumatobacter sp.]MDJ0770110.1 hypothetical protein [Ilumatobacter sp.]